MPWMHIMHKNEQQQGYYFYWAFGKETLVSTVDEWWKDQILDQTSKLTWILIKFLAFSFLGGKFLLTLSLQPVAFIFLRSHWITARMCDSISTSSMSVSWINNINCYCAIYLAVCPLHTVSHLILTKMLWGRLNDHPHVTGEETQPQREEKNCSRSQSYA